MAGGTAYILDQRAELLKLKLKVLAFLGLAVPVIVGGLVLSYGTHFGGVGVIITIGGVITVVQFVMALISLVAGWVGGYEESIRSTVTNHELAQSFESLANDTTINIDEFRHERDVLNAKDDARRAADHVLSITDAEKQMGMRAALRQRQKPCAGCGAIPKNMTPTECGVCGGFKSSRYRAPRIHEPNGA
jgi:mobilome CxxCx(11)CxxC protein